MRATIHNYLDGAKKRREEDGEKGFSLIELIVVVVILGILVAIAIPVFGAIQKQAEVNAVGAAASNGATAVAAAIADGDTTSTVANAISKANAASDKITLSTSNTDTSKVDTVCVTAVSDTDATITKSAGPGC
ncbi:prepilin-type N-terminal cleavage/methylation domain-containing protein [Microbacterium sp. F51-2R]|uniref:prepilin-type N-terminal cleavage/methylation domain-containing protein n=1 Tax=Microbacterium sp. F51-2R TaxID=3445777 RepID=UPI003FA17492